jgi:hypothetical protein
MAKGIRDYGTQKLKDYSREDNGEPRAIVEPAPPTQSTANNGGFKPPKNKPMK